MIIEPNRERRKIEASITASQGISWQNDKWVSLFMTNPMFRIYSFIYEYFLLVQGTVLVLSTKFNLQIGAGEQFSHPC